MSLALLIAGGAVALALMARSARRAWKDHHSLRQHHRTLDALGEVAHHQDSAIAPVPDHASVRAHVRVVNPADPDDGPRPSRPPPTPPPLPAALVASTIDAPILSRPLPHRRQRRRPRWLVARHRRWGWLFVAGIAMAGVVVAVAVLMVVTGVVSYSASGPLVSGRISPVWG